MKAKVITLYSRFTDKSPAVAEKIIRTVRKSLKKLEFEIWNADWLSELPSVIKRYNNTTHNSTKMNPIQASRKSNEEEVYNNLRDGRQKQKLRFKLGQLVRTADMKRVLSKGDSTNWSNKLYTRTQIIHDTTPSYRLKYLPGRYNRKLLLQTKISVDENNQVMKKLILTWEDMT